MTFTERPPRRTINQAGVVRFGAGSRAACMIRNLSVGGAALDFADAGIVPDSFTLMLGREGQERACQAVWRDSRRIGVRFLHPPQADRPPDTIEI
jgi:hypothetical protein